MQEIYSDPNDGELLKSYGKEMGQILLMEIATILNWSKGRLTNEQLHQFLAYDLRALIMHQTIDFSKAFNDLTKGNFQWLLEEKEALKNVLESKWRKLRNLIIATYNGSKLYPDGMLGVYERNIDQIYTTLKTKPKYASFTIPWIRPDLFLVLIRTESKYKQLMN